ncbi:hypothetical protein RY280_23550 [Bacillus paralicheniformis]|uniref:hypothetical protein n=1 Tax=Bacillus paralicheniformis TaxID=1648923 RepID=UPI003A8C851E
MSNYDVVRTVITSFSGQSRTITIPAMFIELTGDYNTASLLNQIIFWSDKSPRKDGWFYKTYEEWTEELLLSKKQVMRSAGKLEDSGIIERKVKRAEGSPTVHYKLNFDVLIQQIQEMNIKKSIGTMESDQRELSKVTKGNFPIEPKGTFESDQREQTLTENYNIRLQQKITTEDNIPVSVQIENLRRRYSDDQLKIIDEYLEMIKHTRVSGKIADSVILKMYKDWDKHPAICVEFGLKTHVDNPAYHSKKENYTLGIIRNATADEAAEKLEKLKSGGHEYSPKRQQSKRRVYDIEY